MKDYLSEVNTLFPMRRSDEEKAKFFGFVVSELGKERVEKEGIDKNNNIVIGDVSEAKVIITAHYDTPAWSLVPNFMVPANKVIGLILNLLFPIITAFFSLAVAFGIGALLSLDDSLSLIIYLVLDFGIFLCMTRLFPNKNNKNDNTSGVATLLSLASNINNKNVAFILFDNEEKGLLGSKAYNKKHKMLMEDKLVINLDCVGNGDNMIFIANEKAEKSAEYSLLLDAFAEEDDYFKVYHISSKHGRANSDHKSFPCSVGVMAANEGGFVRFITGRIHTSKDTVANLENIEFLYNRLSQFLNNI